MSTYPCPNGHPSSEPDYCDTCGAKIGGTAAVAPTSAAPSVPSRPSAASTPSHASGPLPTEICPHCGTPRTGSWRFCEDCGFDHTTGRVPVVDVAPGQPAPSGRWRATVGPDRAYFEANAIEGVEFPAAVAPRTVELSPPQVRIGRRSRSQGTDPELDLSGEPVDPGVSHNHALLTLNIEGVWLVSDLGSTNGTYVNDEAKPLTAGQTRELRDGDRVQVGAWTSITLHAPAR